MKLVKLSLAAIVAAGAMTTFASATSLEEAIKGVDVSGFARARFYHQSKGRYVERGTGTLEHKDDTDGDLGSQGTRISGLLNVNVPIADSLTFGTSLATDGYNHPGNDASFPTGVEVDKFFFQYAADGFVLKAGKFEIPAPWTEAGFGGSRGNGVLALYTPADLGWTFAGAYYNQVNGINDTATDYDIDFLIDGETLDSLRGQEDLFALAAIGAVGPVNAQLWLARMTNLIDTAVFGELSYANSGFKVRGQANYLKLDKDVAALLEFDKSGMFYGIEAGYANDDFFVNVGYTKNDKDQPVHTLDADNDGFIKFGKQLYYLSVNEVDAKVYFINAGANFGKFGVEAGYGVSKDKWNGVNWKYTELYGALSYQIAKNFSTDLYYSVLDGNNDAGNNELRLQVQYNF